MWYLVPVFLLLGFFSKQIAAYFGILITVISLLYVVQKFSVKIIFNVILISWYTNFNFNISIVLF